MVFSHINKSECLNCYFIELQAETETSLEIIWREKNTQLNLSTVKQNKIEEKVEEHTWK